MQYCEDWCIRYRGETFFVARTFDACPCLFQMQRDETYLSFQGLPSVSDPMESHADRLTVLFLAVQHPESDFELEGKGYRILETPRVGPEVFQRENAKSDDWFRVWGEGKIKEPPMRPGQVLVFAYRKQ